MTELIRARPIVGALYSTRARGPNFIFMVYKTKVLPVSIWFNANDPEWEFAWMADGSLIEGSILAESNWKRYYKRLI